MTLFSMFVFVWIFFFFLTKRDKVETKSTWLKETKGAILRTQRHLTTDTNVTMLLEQIGTIWKPFATDSTLFKWKSGFFCSYNP